jgi:DNA-binding response OmpR family regulator
MTKREIDVLIVDDDYITRMIHTRVLKIIKEYDFNIQEAEDGMEALEILSKKKIKEKTPCLILLDSDMPILNGFDFIKECQRMNIFTRAHVIIVSASDHREDKKKAAELGIKYYLIKPLDIEILKSAIVDTIKEY